MRHLVLYVSEGEIGAPGYLSQLGEDGAHNLAESLLHFVSGLGINLECSDKKSFQAFQELMDVKQAIKLESRVLVLSTKGVRSQKTAEIWAGNLGLPVVFLDIEMEQRFQELAAKEQSPALQEGIGGGIDYILSELFRIGGDDFRGPLNLPPLIIMQSPLHSIVQWVEGAAPPELQQSIIESLQSASESDRIPALLAAGLEGPWPGSWLFD